MLPIKPSWINVAREIAMVAKICHGYNSPRYACQRNILGRQKTHPHHPGWPTDASWRDGRAIGFIVSVCFLVHGGKFCHSFFSFLLRNFVLNLEIRFSMVFFNHIYTQILFFLTAQKNRNQKRRNNECLTLLKWSLEISTLQNGGMFGWDLKLYDFSVSFAFIRCIAVTSKPIFNVSLTIVGNFLFEKKNIYF